MVGACAEELCLLGVLDGGGVGWIMPAFTAYSYIRGSITSTVPLPICTSMLDIFFSWWWNRKPWQSEIAMDHEQCQLGEREYQGDCVIPVVL